VSCSWAHRVIQVRGEELGVRSDKNVGWVKRSGPMQMVESGVRSDK
jgi:hypothetical protein